MASLRTVSLETFAGGSAPQAPIISAYRTTQTLALGTSGSTYGVGGVEIQSARDDQALQVFTTGITAQISTNYDRVLISGPTTMTITFPLTANMNDGQVLALECDQTTTLTMVANTGQNLKGTATSCSTTQGHQWHFRVSDLTWRMDY